MGEGGGGSGAPRLSVPEYPPVEGWRAPDAGERWDIIRRSRTVAVVGASGDRARAANFVITYLLSSSVDFEVHLVNPRGREILGRTVYPSLEALPVVPDIVDVFRRSEDLPEVAGEAVAVGARVFWAQLGLWSPQAARLCLDAGLEVVMNRCLKIEHARFSGRLALAGFDTGVISSRRRL